MYRTKMTSKGQVTLPKELRTKLGLKPGDYIQVKETQEGYILEKELDEQRFQKYAGLLGCPGQSSEIVKELRGE